MILKTMFTVYKLPKYHCTRQQLKCEKTGVGQLPNGVFSRSVSIHLAKYILKFLSLTTTSTVIFISNEFIGDVNCTVRQQSTNSYKCNGCCGYLSVIIFLSGSILQ